MKLSNSLLLAAHVLAVLALPAPSKVGEGAVKASAATTAAGAATASATTTAAAAATTSAAAEAGGGEAEKNEVEQKGQFGQVIQLGGGDIKTDTVFPPGVSLIFPPSPSKVVFS